MVTVPKRPRDQQLLDHQAKIDDLRCGSLWICGIRGKVKIIQIIEVREDFSPDCNWRSVGTWVRVRIMASIKPLLKRQMGAYWVKACKFRNKRNVSGYFPARLNIELPPQKGPLARLTAHP